MIGIGVSNSHDSHAAGLEIAREALHELGDRPPPATAIALVGGAHDAARLIGGIRSVLGGVRVVGGSAMGIISHELLGYTGREAALLLVSPALGDMTCLVSDPFGDDEERAGRRLGRRLAAACAEGNAVILFYDGKAVGSFRFSHFCSNLVRGIHAGLDGKRLDMVGARVVGDRWMEDSYILDGDGVARQRAVAVALPARLRARTRTMHGCLPASALYEITRAEGTVIHELDRRPALDVLREATGLSANEAIGERRPQSNLPFRVTLGRWLGGDGDFDEAHYINRLVISTDADAGAIRLLETDLTAGMRVQFMARDANELMASTRRGTERLLGAVDADRIVFAGYIDCGGRTAGMSGTEGEEADIVRSLLTRRVPLLGFYSAGELGPTPDGCRPLDWTGVLTLFTSERAAT